MCNKSGHCQNLQHWFHHGDDAHNRMLLDLDTQCQIQHSLLLSIYPLALTVPIVPDGVSSCIISGRHLVNHTEVSSLNEVTGEAVQTLQNSNLIFSLAKSGRAGIKKWIREPEGGIRKKERQDYPVSPSWQEQQEEKTLSCG